MDPINHTETFKIVKRLFLKYSGTIDSDRWLPYIQKPLNDGGLGFAIENCSIVYMGSESVQILVTFKTSIYPYHPRIFDFEGIRPLIEERD